MTVNRCVWENKKGKIEGVNLVECGSSFFYIVNKIREVAESKGVKSGCFCLSDINKYTWQYGIFQKGYTFFNKIVLKGKLNYDYIYSFDTGKLYKVVQGA